MAQPAAEAMPIYLESSNAMRQGVVLGKWKLIRDRETGVVEFYDLVFDPRERTNLADRKPREMQSLYCQLLSHFDPHREELGRRTRNAHRGLKNLE